jgi:hypothetical protein
MKLKTYQMRRVILLYIALCMTSIANANYNSATERARKGDVSDQINLGESCYKKMNYAGAIKWFTCNGQKTKDAWKLNSEINAMMGIMYYQGRQGIQQDYQEAFKYCSMAVNIAANIKCMVNTRCIYYLGVIYGRGVSSNKSEVIKWYRKYVESTIKIGTLSEEEKSALQRLGYNFSKQTRKTDVEKEGLKGRVSRIKTSTCELVTKDNRTIQDCFDISVTEYNYDGFITGKYDYKKDGSLRVATVYEYQGGNLIKKIDQWDDRTYIITCKSDGNGNIIEEYSRDVRGDINSKTVFKYDDSGNIIEIEFFINHIDGEQLESQFRYTYLYDANGNIIEDKRFEGQNSFSAKTRYLYNSIGDLVELRIYNPDGKLETVATSVYKIDSRGNWIEQKKSYSNGTKYITKREIEYF